MLTRNIFGTAPPLPLRAMVALLPHRCQCDTPDLTSFYGPTCRCKPSLPVGVQEASKDLENQIKERQGLFFDMEAYLPKKNG